jgi:periplasmic copper chaperone A
MRSLRRLLSVIAFVAFAALAGAACGDDSSTGSTTGGAAPTVSGAWARASAASQTDGAAYLVITGGSSADQLVGATVPADVAGKAEIHETMMASGSAMSGMSGMTGSTGMMEMKPVSSIAIPKGKAVTFEPGGYHVMLVGLAKPLATGQRFTLTLTFEKAGKVDVPVEVRAS